MSSSSKQSTEIPVIDLSCLLTKNKVGLNAGSSESMLDKLRKACEEWGCFLVVNHGIRSEIIANMDMAARHTFKLPKETKERNKFSKALFSYTKMSRYNESLGVPGVPDPQQIQLFSQQLWPHGNPEICKTIEEYTSSVKELTDNIIKQIYRTFEVSKYYGLHEFWGLLRMNCYDFSEYLDAAEEGFPAHRDDGCITVMYQDAVGGLEVWSKANEWIEVKPICDSFVVLMGHAFWAWSNETIHNVVHRVTTAGACQTPRVSLPYFTYFPQGTEVEPAPEFVDDQHPRTVDKFVVQYTERRD